MKQIILAALLACVSACACASAAAPAPPPEQTALPPPSSSAQKLYSLARNDLLQVRVLLKNGHAQASVGSGFLIGASNLVVTNYHVVSQIAREPEIYAGEYVDTLGRRGAVELFAVDVLHDLAVLRIDRHGDGFLNLPEQAPELTQGQYLYSLGNPLDLGFAISEGAYNGIITRGFSDQLMFTGPINAGMSGGPNVTADGRVAGVNVSKRLDGELVSFLVPVRFVQELLKKVAQQQRPPKDFNLAVGEQLLQYQALMMDTLLATPLTLKALGPYLVPVRESDQVRCWGQSTNKADNPYMVDQMQCAMESAVYVSEQLQTGQVSMRHQLMRSAGLGALRFSQLASNSFKNERFGSSKDQRLTGPVCTEQFVNNQKLPLRAVLCVRAYRKFAGLYDFSLLIASADQPLMSLQSRLNARGVSYENGLRITQVFLNSISRGKPP
jgi:S1-C subfamily serine protease